MGQPFVLRTSVIMHKERERSCASSVARRKTSVLLVWDVSLRREGNKFDA
jgi:hypothetical protein